MKEIKQRLRIAITKTEDDRSKTSGSNPPNPKTMLLTKVLSSINMKKQIIDKENSAPLNQMRTRQRYYIDRGGHNVVDYAGNEHSTPISNRFGSMDHEYTTNDFGQYRTKLTNDSFLLSKKDFSMPNITGTHFESQFSNPLMPDEMNKDFGSAQSPKKLLDSHYIDKRIFKTLTQNIQIRNQEKGVSFKSSSQPDIFDGKGSARGSLPHNDKEFVHSESQKSQEDIQNKQTSRKIDQIKKRVGIQFDRTNTDEATRRIKVGEIVHFRGRKSTLTNDRNSSQPSSYSHQRDNSNSVTSKGGNQAQGSNNRGSLPPSTQPIGRIDKVKRKIVDQSILNKSNSCSNMGNIISNTGDIRQKLKEKLQRRGFRDENEGNGSELRQSQPGRKVKGVINNRQTGCEDDKRVNSQEDRSRAERIVSKLRRQLRNPTMMESSKSKLQNKSVGSNNAGVMYGRRKYLKTEKSYANLDYLKNSQIMLTENSAYLKSIKHKPSSPKSKTKISNFITTQLGSKEKEASIHSISPASNTYHTKAYVHKRDSGKKKTHFEPDTPTKMPDCPLFLTKLGVDTESLALLNIPDEAFRLDIYDLLHPVKQEEKNQTATFTFNNDQYMSKKNSVITFKEDFSNEKSSTGFANSAVRRREIEMRQFGGKIDFGRKRSEQKPPTSDTQMHRMLDNDNDPTSYINSLTKRANSGLSSILKLPHQYFMKGRFDSTHPDDIVPSTQLFRRSREPEMEVAVCSALNSFIDDEEDNKDYEQIRNKTFESTESLLINIDKDANHEDNAIRRIDGSSQKSLQVERCSDCPSWEKYEEDINQHKLDSNHTQMNPSGDVIMQSLDENSSSVIDENENQLVLQNQHFRSTSEELNISCKGPDYQAHPGFNFQLAKGKSSDSQASCIHIDMMDAIDPQLQSSILAALVIPTLRLAQISPTSLVLSFSKPIHTRPFAKSNKKKVTMALEFDRVCLPLPKQRIILNTDITNIEDGDYGKAISIDDRELKSLFGLKSVDLNKQIDIDRRDKLLIIDRQYEKDDFLQENQNTRPPRGGMKSQRTYDRPHKAPRDFDLSPTLAPKIQKNSWTKSNNMDWNKLSLSGSDIHPEASQELHHPCMSEKLEHKKYRHFDPIPVEEEIMMGIDEPDSAFHGCFKKPPMQPKLLVQPSTNQPDLPLKFTAPGPTLLTKPALSTKSPLPQQLNPSSRPTLATRNKPKVRLDENKDCQSIFDTYSLSSETHSIYKTKSSHNLYSNVYFDLNSDNKPLGDCRDGLREDEQCQSFCYRSVSGNVRFDKERTFRRFDRSNDSDKEKFSSTNGREVNSKQAAAFCSFDKEDAKAQFKNSRFNFFGSNDKLGDGREDSLNRFIQRQIQGLGDIKKIVEVDESNLHEQSQLKNSKLIKYPQVDMISYTNTKPLTLMTTLIGAVPPSKPSKNLSQSLASLGENLTFNKSNPSKFAERKKHSRTARGEETTSRSHLQRTDRSKMSITSSKSKLVSFEVKCNQNIATSAKQQLQSSNSKQELQKSILKTPQQMTYYTSSATQGEVKIPKLVGLQRIAEMYNTGAPSSREDKISASFSQPESQRQKQPPTSYNLTGSRPHLTVSTSKDNLLQSNPHYKQQWTESVGST